VVSSMKGCGTREYEGLAVFIFMNDIVHLQVHLNNHTFVLFLFLNTVNNAEINTFMSMYMYFCFFFNLLRINFR
jgi:hypothetical protein